MQQRSTGPLFRERTCLILLASGRANPRGIKSSGTRLLFVRISIAATFQVALASPWLKTESPSARCTATAASIAIAPSSCRRSAPRLARRLARGRPSLLRGWLLRVPLELESGKWETTCRCVPESDSIKLAAEPASCGWGNWKPAAIYDRASCARAMGPLG